MESHRLTARGAWERAGEGCFTLCSIGPIRVEHRFRPEGTVLSALRAGIRCSRSRQTERYLALRHAPRPCRIDSCSNQQEKKKVDKAASFLYHADQSAARANVRVKPNAQASNDTL